MNDRPRILVICTGNSMRSQMAEGLLRADLGNRVDVFSAGVSPSFVHPAVVSVLREIGIDITGHRSKSVEEFFEEDLDLVITLCDYAAEHCPRLPNAERLIHHPYPDPTRHGPDVDALDFLRQMRDAMREDLRALIVKELGL